LAIKLNLVGLYNLFGKLRLIHQIALTCMIPVNKYPLVRSWVRVLICVLLAGLFALGYWQGQRTVREEMNALVAKGINSGRGNDSGRPNVAQGIPLILPASIPADASPEMKEFMQNRATLMQKMAELCKQNPNTNGAPDPKIFAQFQQENKALLQRQRELAQTIGQQQAKNPLPTPAPLQIPPNTSPQMQAYLTARDQLMREQIAFMNQHRTDDSAMRQAAMQQWRQQNATRFQQLQQLAQTTPTK